MCIFTESIFSKGRQDLELPNLECVWVEIKTHSKELLIGTFYRPPKAPIATLTAIGDTIGKAADTNAHDIFLTGDFNINMADVRNSTCIKIKNLCQEYGLSHSTLVNFLNNWVWYPPLSHPIG